MDHNYALVDTQQDDAGQENHRLDQHLEENGNHPLKDHAYAVPNKFGANFDHNAYMDDNSQTITLTAPSQTINQSTSDVETLTLTCPSQN